MGGIIPWDNDIDICFIDSEWKKLLKIKTELEENGLKYNDRGYRFCRFGLIDCFKITLKDDYYSGYLPTYLHKDEIKQVRKQIFGYTYIYAPFCCSKTLAYRYGDTYFTEGDVNDNYHFKDKKTSRFKLEQNDLSYQIK